MDLNYNRKNCLLFDLLFGPSNMLIYDHLFAPGKLLSNFLKCWHFWGASLTLALFVKKVVIITPTQYYAILVRQLPQNYILCHLDKISSIVLVTALTNTKLKTLLLINKKYSTKNASFRLVLNTLRSNQQNSEKFFWQYPLVSNIYRVYNLKLG